MKLAKRDVIVLGGVAALCVALMLAALLMRTGAPSSPAAQAGLAPEGAAGAAPVDGAAASGSPSSGSPSSGSPTPGAAPTAEAQPVAEPSSGPSFTSEQNRREVTLFFEEMNSESLAPEKRKIFLTTSITDQAKQIVVELINGPLDKGLLPTLPSQTLLRGLYLDRTGTAYVDLSHELVDFHPGGTDEEIATIFSLVDTLTYNLPEIKRVHVLVNGEERDTLKSHLDLHRDYTKDMSIVDMDHKN